MHLLAETSCFNGQTSTLVARPVVEARYCFSYDEDSRGLVWAILRARAMNSRETHAPPERKQKTTALAHLCAES